MVEFLITGEVSKLKEARPPSANNKGRKENQMSYDVSFKFNPYSDGKYYHSLSLFVEVFKSFNGTIKYCVCTSFYDCFVRACVSPIFDNVEAAFDFADFLVNKYPNLETDDYPWGNFDLYPIFDKKLMEVNSNENK